jgi:hypothetical protein
MLSERTPGPRVARAVAHRQPRLQSCRQGVSARFLWAPTIAFHGRLYLRAWLIERCMFLVL